jgi:arginase family enzyme
MDFSLFLRPSEWHNVDGSDLPSSSLFHDIQFFNGEDDFDWTSIKLAFFTIQESRNSRGNEGCQDAGKYLRDELYSLTKWDLHPGWVDLGDVAPGETVDDTYFAVRSICEELIKRQIVPVIVGGSQDLTYANYLAYEKLEQTINLVTIDHRLDFATTHEDQSSQGYLNKIVLHRPNYLFNYSNLGHQRYLTDPDLLTLVEKMYFDATRLGEVQGNLKIVEPVIRNADMISIDLSSMRHSEFPATAIHSANGFFGNEMAQMARYAGMSDKLTSVGFYEFNPVLDQSGHSASMLAQIIWCFVEGFLQRKGDFPKGSYDEYTQYTVLLDESGDNLVFYKSPMSGRWWMDVPYPAGSMERYERHHLVPCSYEDYELAMSQEMPDRWWRTFQKLV